MSQRQWNRRELIEAGLATLGGLTVFGLFGCGKDGGNGNGPKPLFLGSPARGDRKEITLYDTHAMATYFDGGLGPKTGIIKVDYVIKGEAVKFKFWHGHGGKDHEFTLLPEHIADIKKLKKVWIETTKVDGHAHKLFIDPVNPKYRVAGAQPVVVTVEDV